MNAGLLASIQRWFGEFTDGYRAGGALHPMLELKLEHSLRVAADSRIIASRLGWSADAVRSAEAAGLLHDVGRFPQFSRFGTFQDRVSVNHGEEGARVLETAGILGAAGPAERAAVLCAVRHHNARALPAPLAELELQYLKLARDADKIDIMYVISDAIRHDKMRRHPELLLNVSLDGPPTPELIAEIKESRSASYDNLRSLADMNLIRLTWIYDLNYPPAIELILQRDLFAEMCGVLPPHPEIDAIVRDAERFVAGRVAAAAPAPA
jgi:putative nucleotidyltransferase with HDIG domain